MIAKIQSKMYLGKQSTTTTDEREICTFRYLNDLYVLECKGNNYGWEHPIVRGTPPTERESHSCVFYRGQVENRPKLIVYGGMNGHRMGDLWSFHLGKRRADGSRSIDFLCHSKTSRNGRRSSHPVSLLNLVVFIQLRLLHIGTCARLTRSLESTFLLFSMFIFGGWVPLISSDSKEPFANEKEWKCTNTLASINLGTSLSSRSRTSVRVSPF
jgi:host cell factor